MTGFGVLRPARRGKINEGDRMTEIFRSEYTVVTLEHGGQIVRSTRSSTPYPSVEAFRDEIRMISSKLDQIGRFGRGLLADLRAGPARNDPAFEQAMHAVLPELRRGFRGIAVVVRSAAGALQIRRNLVSEPNSIVSSDEAEAVEWLLTGRD